tara:strand:- start:8727 stop:8927 length:201 start_codon:yes stop_codon:yes gene_type:complete
MKDNGKMILEVKTPRVFDTEKVFLEYFNDYLTIEKMAEHYGLPLSQMKTLIESGRQVNYLRSNQNK